MQLAVDDADAQRVQSGDVDHLFRLAVEARADAEHARVGGDAGLDTRK